ncbi:hypothetical protein [Cronobacter sakazakii]|uniref:hypothetical protein n=1 Tax=Cronobacter sakazakii TaxID=28141 RepID=UPI0028942A9A|nr:hypothetical protein [Cronobacter sakazakii]MDT3569900.1 hypothetical protein [Cronobacter sakazakii]
MSDLKITITKHTFQSLKTRLKEIALAWRQLEKFNVSVWRNELMGKLVAEFIRLLPQVRKYGLLQ